MSALQRVIDALKTESGFALSNSRRADTMCPDSKESRGSVFLLNVRDDVVERVEHMREDSTNDPDDLARLLRESDDLAHEIADSAVPVYTHPMWLTFVDLGAYQEDISDFTEGGVKVDALPGIALYVIGRRLAERLLSDLADAAAEDARTEVDDTGNPYVIGTTEWHAWGHGHDYAETHERRDNPLSGEWAGDPTPQDVIRAAWRSVMGPSWDTYQDGTPGDRDSDDAICEAWEEGATAEWEGDK